MSSEPVDPGKNSGFSVQEAPGGGYRWSAFGPSGTREGKAETRADAEAVAREAEQQLNGPWATDRAVARLRRYGVKLW
jgi:hypothetical protein